MPYRSFRIPVCSPDWAERELNTFLAGHRVLAVDRHWVDQGENSFWAVWVDYLDSTTESSPRGLATSDSKKKVDYKVVLSPDDFAVFAQLRVLRKELAAEDGVALYNVFTNEQLAQIVQSHTRTLEDLKGISGIGQARIDKYGARVLELMKTTQEVTNEANRQSAESDR
jgi:superfamily II DNA helicase RecQ